MAMSSSRAINACPYHMIHRRCSHGCIIFGACGKAAAALEASEWDLSTVLLWCLHLIAAVHQATRQVLIGLNPPRLSLWCHGVVKCFVLGAARPPIYGWCHCLEPSLVHERTIGFSDSRTIGRGRPRGRDPVPRGRVRQLWVSELTSDLESSSFSVRIPSLLLITNQLLSSPSFGCVLCCEASGFEICWVRAALSLNHNGRLFFSLYRGLPFRCS